MKFVSALVFTAMALSVSAHASAPSNDGVQCPYQTANPDQKVEGLKTAELVVPKNRTAPVKTQSTGKGTIRR